jgi:DNA-binding XRE family transcriptional regulator
LLVTRLCLCLPRHRARIDVPLSRLGGPQIGVHIASGGLAGAHRADDGGGAGDDVAAPPPPQEAKGVRFSARSVKAQRARLGLSAKDFGRLVGVSALTVYSWESGKSRPRKKQLAGLAAVRRLGKREARKRLEMIGEK